MIRYRFQKALTSRFAVQGPRFLFLVPDGVMVRFGLAFSGLEGYEGGESKGISVMS